MKINNQILNYFVSPPSSSGGDTMVFLSPVTMNADVGKILINKELKDKQLKSKLLHVCFDLDSKIIYIPNAREFMPSQIAPLLNAAKEKIRIDFGSISNDTEVEGSPFSLIRIRKVSNFGYTNEAIRSHFVIKTFYSKM